VAEHFSLHHVSILETANSNCSLYRVRSPSVNVGRLRKVALPDGRASDTADLTNEIRLSRLSEKTKILRRELVQVREHRRQQRRIQSVPTRQGGAILIY
jgi:hypothetical protein